MSFVMLLSAQPIKTFVNPSGITLKDLSENQTINLDGNAKLIEIRINDSLMLNIQGGHTTSIKLLNPFDSIEIGMELYSDGTFSFGEFEGAPPPELGSTLNIRNGLFRPAPNTQAIATGNQERLRITADGDIGIGTLTPLERLDVDGGVRIGFAALEPGPITYPYYDLKIDEEGIIFKTLPTSPPDGPQQGALLEFVEKQNRTIEALTKRLAKLEERVKMN